MTKPAKKKPEGKPEGQEVRADRKQLRLIERWKKLQAQHVIIEPQLKGVRAELLKTIAPGTYLSSKHGTLVPETQHSLDFSQLCRRLVGGGFILEAALESLIESCQKESAPFLRAPRAWGAEVKLASELEEAA